jgi:hypothetical protein
MNKNALAIALISSALVISAAILGHAYLTRFEIESNSVNGLVRLNKSTGVMDLCAISGMDDGEAIYRCAPIDPSNPH